MVEADVSGVSISSAADHAAARAGAGVSRTSGDRGYQRTARRRTRVCVGVDTTTKTRYTGASRDPSRLTRRDSPGDLTSEQNPGAIGRYADDVRAPGGHNGRLLRIRHAVAVSATAGACIRR